MIKLLTTITLFLFVTVLAYHKVTHLAYAQTSSSSTYVTCISINGKKVSKNCTPGPKGENVSNNELENASQDLYDAINSCYSSTPISISMASSGCTNGNLQKTQFSSHIGVADENTGSINPLQCTAFVYMSVALATGSSISTSINEAKDMLQYPQFSAGNNTYKELPPNSIPQPGDVGVAGPYSGQGIIIGGAGHILVVKQPQGKAGFIALEANYEIPDASGALIGGYIKDSNLYPDEIFRFYRKQ